MYVLTLVLCFLLLCFSKCRQYFHLCLLAPNLHFFFVCLFDFYFLYFCIIEVIISWLKIQHIILLISRINKFSKSKFLKWFIKCDIPWGTFRYMMNYDFKVFVLHFFKKTITFAFVYLMKKIVFSLKDQRKQQFRNQSAWVAAFNF